MNSLRYIGVSLVSILLAVTLVLTVGESIIIDLIATIQSLSLKRRTILMAATVGIGLILIELGTIHIFGVSPVEISILIISVLASALISNEKPTSGRHEFAPSAGDRLRRIFERSGLFVDDVMKRDPDADLETPKLGDGVSTAVTGQTRNGKSAFVKGEMTKWDKNVAVVAHAIAENEGRNEMEDHLRDTMCREIIRISSRDSTHRWDPFLDNPQNTQSINRISDMMFGAGDPPQTGWTPGAKSYLRAVLTICSVEFDDFSRVPEVLSRDPANVVDRLDVVPGTKMLRQALSANDNLLTIQQVLINSLGTILTSETFNSQLPALSLFDYYNDPTQKAIVLNNYEADTFAHPFFRFFLESAISYALESRTYEYFVLDEVDKLPRIRNLSNLASAGAKVNCEAIVMFQNKTEMDHVYGSDVTDTIWSNAPNRVSFRCGDTQTADLVLGSLGQKEIEATSVSVHSAKTSTTRSHTDRLPVTQHTLTHLSTGEALVSSPHGWWLCDLTDSGY